MTPWEINRSLRKNRRVILDQVGRLLDRAIAVGADAAQVAKRIAQYVNPWYTPRRDANGLRRRDTTRQGLQANWPAQAGMASQHAHFLAVFATNEAHREALIATALTSPESAIRWDLSPSHSRADDCNDLAARDAGLGPGVYWPQDVPSRPHAGCQCILSIQSAVTARVR